MTEDKTINVPAADPLMLAAMIKAKATMPQFIEALSHRKAGQNAFQLKVEFTEGDQTEFIWIADLDFSGPMPRGVVANEPHIKGLKFMQTIQFSPQKVADWMYIDHGILIGGYTTRVLRDKLNTEGRKAFDSQAPFKFE